jgi:hypothetical protein
MFHLRVHSPNAQHSSRNGTCFLPRDVWHDAYWKVGHGEVGVGALPSEQNISSFTAFRGRSRGKFARLASQMTARKAESFHHNAKKLGVRVHFFLMGKWITSSRINTLERRREQKVKEKKKNPERTGMGRVGFRYRLFVLPPAPNDLLGEKNGDPSQWVKFEQ